MGGSSDPPPLTCTGSSDAEVKIGAVGVTTGDGVVGEATADRETRRRDADEETVVASDSGDTDVCVVDEVVDVATVSCLEGALLLALWPGTCLDFATDDDEAVVVDAGAVDVAG